MQKNAVEIVVIEDKQEDRQSIVSALSNFVQPRRIADFADEITALDFIAAAAQAGERKSSEIRLIVLDFHLKQGKAPQLLEELRARESTTLTPVVILSDSGDPRDIRESYESGANAFVRKPVYYADFKDTLELIGRFWLDMNEPGT